MRPKEKEGKNEEKQEWPHYILKVKTLSLPLLALMSILITEYFT